MDEKVVLGERERVREKEREKRKRERKEKKSELTVSTHAVDRNSPNLLAF